MPKSIEEKVEDWCKKQLDNYFTKTEKINDEIEIALKSAPSKKGGEGNNFPDIKCFIESQNMRKIPVMIEVKGTKGDFGKFDKDGNILNIDKNGDPNYTVIAKYAVNGAVHYGNAILTYTESYKEVVAIGINGYEENKKLVTEIGVYYISDENLFIPKKVADYSDLSFLKKENIEKFIRQIDELKLTDEEKEKQKLELEDDIEKRLKNINQKMHDDLGIVVGARVKLISGLIMAGLGVQGKVSGLKVEDLKGELGENSNDGKIIINKITDFLSERNLPKEKKEIILNELKNVFLYSKLEVPENGESKLKTVYTCVKNDILPFLTKDLHNIDFTGRLFNVLNEWVDVPDGAENDVVLTPRYVTELMAKLCEVNKDSYVWDYATGSAGFLISSMNLMIEDVKKKVTSPEEQNKKIVQIKAEQLLGIEKLPDIYLLAVLNMILMGDGSSNIIHGDSITEFEGNYEQGKLKGEKFPANVFLLNPPYSAPGKGFNFVEKALSKMSGGKAAVLIQENAGSSQGADYTKEILKNNTLLASIHMSADLFIGKSNVQTAIYVFEVGKPHDTEKLVKFIDFSNDGYIRQSRKKSSQSINLKDTGNAKARYEELVNLVVRGKGKDDKNLNYFKECYEEDYITLNGDDWTYSQHKKNELNPSYEEFMKDVRDYLAWRISDVLKNGYLRINEHHFKENSKSFNNYELKLGKFKIGDIFEKIATRYKGKGDKFKAVSNKKTNDFKYPMVYAKFGDNGIMYWGKENDFETKANVLSIIYNGAIAAGLVYAQPFETGILAESYLIRLKNEEISFEATLYLASVLKKVLYPKYSRDYLATWTDKVENDYIYLPLNSKNKIDFEYMENFICKLEIEAYKDLKEFLLNNSFGII